MSSSAVADLDLAVLDLDLMHEDIAELLLRVGDSKRTPGADDDADSPTWPPDSP